MMVMHLHSKSIHCQAWRSPTDEQEELIDLQCDEGVQEKFKNHKMAEFRLNVSPSYTALAKNEIPQLLIFPTTWEWKQGFSTFLTIKSKQEIVS